MLDAMLGVAEAYVHPQQEIYLKVSPNSTPADVDDTTDIAKNHRVNGIVTAKVG